MQRNFELVRACLVRSTIEAIHLKPPVSSADAENRYQRYSRDEEQTNKDDDRNNIYQPKRNDVRIPALNLGSKVVHNRAHQAPNTGPELERRERHAAVPGWRDLLDVQLGKSHEEPVGEAQEQTSKVQGSDRGRRHHDDVGHAAHDACDPDARLAADLPGNGTSGAGSNDCAESH